MGLHAQRVQTHPVQPRHNRLRQKCEYPSLLWNVLSRGQATQHAPCAQRKMVFPGLRIEAGWATGTTRVAVPPGPRQARNSIHFCFFFCYTRVWSSSPLPMGRGPHTFMSVSLGKLGTEYQSSPTNWHRVQANRCSDGRQFPPAVAFSGDGNGNIIYVHFHWVN